PGSRCSMAAPVSAQVRDGASDELGAIVVALSHFRDSLPEGRGDRSPLRDCAAAEPRSERTLHAFPPGTPRPRGRSRRRSEVLSSRSPRGPLPVILAHERLTAPDSAPERLMLVLHGIFGAGRNWATVARRILAERPEWGAVLVDLRQHGSS